MSGLRSNGFKVDGIHKLVGRIHTTRTRTQVRRRKKTNKSSHNARTPLRRVRGGLNRVAKAYYTLTDRNRRIHICRYGRDERFVRSQGMHKSVYSCKRHDAGDARQFQHNRLAPRLRGSEAWLFEIPFACICGWQGGEESNAGIGRPMHNSNNKHHRPNQTHCRKESRGVVGANEKAIMPSHALTYAKQIHYICQCPTCSIVDLRVDYLF